MQQFKDFPDHIAHTPVYVVPYFAHDPDKENDTDAQFITVGWSQWDGDEPAAKVVRHSGQRWSRQSEELPLGRLVDLTILTALALGSGSSFTQVDTGVFESQTFPIDVAHGSKRDRTALTEELKTNQTLKRRFKKLFSILQKIDAEGGLD
jgi:Family of unknown function (DUF6530)